MAVYVVTGKLGSGKTLAAVGRIRDYLRQGRRVATNLDLRLDALMGELDAASRVVRVPDRPSALDLEALGLGADSVDEGRFGLLVLDELGAWLNARQWGDKGRQALIDWLVHSRKRRWDVCFIVQHASMIDKQVREALMEYLVTCKRLDRIRVPLLGPLGRLLTFGLWDGRGPKVHLALVVYAGGSASLQSALVSDRWVYRARDLYPAYDTEQVFRDLAAGEVASRGGSIAAGSYSFLPGWHIVGRHRPRQDWRALVAREWRTFLWSCGLADAAPAHRPPPEKLKPLLRLPGDVRWAAARSLVARGVL